MAETISKADACYALDIVRAICSQVGPGMPGTPQERQRAAFIQSELASHLGNENVAEENFTLAPGAFLGALPLSAVMLLAAAMLNISIAHFPIISPGLTTFAALLLSALALTTFFVEYIRYKEFVDPFFKKKQSVNIIGRLLKPEDVTVKRLLILSGHHDSAPENTWIGLLGYGLYVTVPTMMIAFILMLAMSILQLIGWITGSSRILDFGTLGWIPLAYPILPAVIFGLFFNRGRRNGGTVPGAADNLSASALTLAMCRFLVKNPDYIPEETEIRFISFGSEEAGLRGSRRYVKRHLDELQRLDARLLNYETVAYPEIFIMTSDVGGVKHSPEMVKSLVAAAQRAGVPFQVKPSPTGGGGTDAGSFSQAGLRAATLMPFKVPQQLVAFYHQKKDTPEILTIEPLLNVLKLTFEWVRCGGEQAETNRFDRGHNE